MRPRSLIQQPERWATATNSALYGEHKSPASKANQQRHNLIHATKPPHAAATAENDSTPDGVRGAR